MKKYFLIMPIFSTLTFSALADESFVGSPALCGKYKIRGVARIIDNDIVFMVNEKTKSQIKLSMPVTEEVKLGPFIDRPVVLTGVLLSKMDGTNGTLNEIIGTPEKRIPDPMRPGDTGFHFLSSENCLK